MTMSAIVTFFQEWRQESNPWRECYREGGGVFEAQFWRYSLGFVLLYNIGNYIQRSYHAAAKNTTDNKSAAPDDRSLKALIASRPTVLAGSIHSIATAVIAVGILILRHLAGDSSWEYQGIDLIKIWQTVGLPISLSYFVADCFFYCLPRKDLIIFVHHVIMCFCHYPVSHDSGALLAGVGDREWITWLSIMGYTSEVSTAFMNYRWYLLNTLEENWIGFGIVNVLVVAGFGGRVVMFSYLLIWEIFPRASMYVAKKQIVTYAVMVFGHVGIGLLSLYWCVVMCRGGFKSLFVFKKKKSQPANQQQGFSFADVARCDASSPTKVDAGDSNPPNSPSRIMQNGLGEARAYVDGTFYNEGVANNGKKRQ